ncbi:hypothetical protein Z043_120458, partial [Scleropages formosus]
PPRVSRERSAYEAPVVLRCVRVTWREAARLHALFPVETRGTEKCGEIPERAGFETPSLSSRSRRNALNHGYCEHEHGARSMSDFEY